jgi:hypothetical protein
MDHVVYVYNGLDVVRREGRLFVRYDAGAHAVKWREDEITEDEFRRITAGPPDSVRRILIEIENRLIERGIDPYESNWEPPKKKAPNQPPEPTR